MASFDYQPTLSDTFVRLRPLRPEDWDALYAVARDPAIWAVHPATERWQEPSFRAWFEGSLASGGALVIEDARSGAVIGSSRYDRERALDGEVEIGWTFLSREYWGGPTNLAVKRLMIDHALGRFDRVIFLIGEANIRSRRALEKIGGTLTERVLEAAVEGRPVNHVIYAIDHAAFANGPLGARDQKGQAMLSVSETFKDNLAQLPPIDGIQRIDLRDGAGALVASIENVPGKQGSLAVYVYLKRVFGALDAGAAEHGLAVFAEHSADARNRPGAHPNVDRLLAIVAGGAPLTIEVIAG